MRSACPLLAALAACCRGAPGCVHVRLRAIQDGRWFQYRRRRLRRRLRLLQLRCLRVRDRLEGMWRHQSLGAVVRVCGARLLYRLKGTQQLHSAHSFGSQGSRQQQQQEEETPPLPSILSQSLRSEDTTSGSTTNAGGDTGTSNTSNVGSTFTVTDAGTHSSWSSDPFLAFATLTIFAASARGLEHGADIVRDSAAYDRQSDYGRAYA